MSLFPLGILGPFACLGFPQPLLLTLYFHGLLLTSLDFPGPITSYSSLGFMGLPSIPYSLCLHCFGPAAAHFLLFFHITHCPWVYYSLFLSFRAFLSPFAFSRPIYLFYGHVIHYSGRLGLMFFLFSISCQLLCVAELGFLSSIWVSQKKTLNKELKAYLAHPSVLSRPEKEEVLYAYIVVTQHVVSLVLIWVDGGIQKPVYYVNKSLQEAEVRYLPLEKAILAVIHATKKVPYYFQAHMVIVLT